MDPQSELIFLAQKEVDSRLQLISSSYERASNYTNLIILAGYAGTFTLWSFTKDFLPEKTALICALLLLVSLFTFCLWEVSKMIFSGFLLQATVNILFEKNSPEALFQKLEAQDNIARRKNVALHRWWQFVLLLTVPTGFGAGLLLAYNYFAKLSGLPCWPN